MPDSEVANAFVTIGAKTDALKAGFRDAETLTRATLSNMGRQVTAFATAFGGKLGIGAVVGGGAAAVAAGAIKATEATAASLANLGQKAGEAGAKFEDQLAVVEKFTDKWAQLIPLTRNQALEMGALGLVYGFANEKLANLLETSAGLAEGFGTPQEAQRAILGTVTGKQGLLEQFGIIGAFSTAEQARQAAEEQAAVRIRGAEARGGIKPGAKLEAVGAGISGLFSAVSEVIREGLGFGQDFVVGGLEAGARGAEDAASFFRAQGGGRFPLTSAVAEFGAIGAASVIDTLRAKVEFPERGLPSRAHARFLEGLSGRTEEEAGGVTARLFSNVAEAETGLSGPERLSRGTNVAGDGGREVSEAMQQNTAALRKNTAALETQGSVIREQP